MNVDREAVFRPWAILLVGPTGSGKTPLGEALERQGLWGARAVHFDFGRALRAAAADDRFADELRLTADERAHVREVLRTGALLEPAAYPIARKLLDRVTREHGVRADAWLVLNGFPRAPEQAEWIETYVDVRALVHLRADAATVSARIRTNIGGDRAGRDDDDADSVARRLELYARRTRPLIDYYRARGVRLLQLPVTPTTTAEELVATLENLGPPPDVAPPATLRGDGRACGQSVKER